MYYVLIKQHNKPDSTFLGFSVPKYIASKNNKNVIFLFQRDGKVIRKWVKLEDIILLTDDKEYFLEIYNQFKKVEEEQKALVEAARTKLQESMTNFVDTMNAHIDEYEEIRDSTDVPCILKDLG